MTNMPQARRAYENRIRRLARKHGFAVRKARVRNLLGEYMLVDEMKNHLIMGEDFSASLEEIEDYLTSWGLQ